MEKEVYEMPQMEVVEFDPQDTIRTSCTCFGWYDEGEG